MKILTHCEWNADRVSPSGFINQRIHSFLQDATKEVTPTLISDACLVVDVLGPDVRSVRHFSCIVPTDQDQPLQRNHIVERYCSIELREYRRIFRANDEVRVLVALSFQVSRTDAWCRRVNLTMFPAALLGFVEFLRITKKSEQVHFRQDGRLLNTFSPGLQKSPGTQLLDVTQFTSNASVILGTIC